MSTQKTAKYPELAAAFTDVKRYFIYAGLFSAAVNLLMLVPCHLHAAGV
jgi:ATP-binding cassette subfamily C protein EexD